MTIQPDGTAGSLTGLRQTIVGVDQEVPLLDGSQRVYVNLDNAASTPAFQRVRDKVDEMLVWYSSIHRGSGFKSMLSTQLYDQAREIVLDFVGADPLHDCIIFCKNATEALNRLANLYPFRTGDMVLTTAMEHHSNDLPWRAVANVLHAGVFRDGALDMVDFQTKLEQNSGRIKLVAITGASNVSGYMPPIYEIAEMAHQHGAQILVDSAQLLPHRKIIKGADGEPRALDFIVFSAHKVYAPFGSGGLIGPLDFFNALDPEHRGGGTVEIVTLNEVTWTKAPERDEAGSPNVIGAIALATALKVLSEVGMENLAHHETELTRYALQRLLELNGITIFGSQDPRNVQDRVGVIPFQVDGMAHGKVAAILGFEGGIGVRNGCFCAHPYILNLLGVTEEEYRNFHANVLHGNRIDLPGLIRISFGCYNEAADVDHLIEMLQRIVAGDYKGDYVAEHCSGSYYPRNFDAVSTRRYFGF